MTTASSDHQTSVSRLHVGRLHYASEKDVVERARGRRPGCRLGRGQSRRPERDGDLRPGDPSLEDLRAWIEECGRHELRTPASQRRRALDAA
jgi:hypothetical protein